MLGGGARGVQVVVQDPVDRALIVGAAVGGCEGSGVFTEQIMQPVAAGGRFGDQVLVVQGR